MAEIEQDRLTTSVLLRQYLKFNAKPRVSRAVPARYMGREGAIDYVGGGATPFKPHGAAERRRLESWRITFRRLRSARLRQAALLRSVARRCALAPQSPLVT